MNSPVMKVVSFAIFLFIFYAHTSAVNAYNLNKTVDISANLNPGECAMVNIPHHVDSDQLQARCEGICNFYILTEKEFALFKETGGRQGTPLVFEIFVLPDVLVTLRVDSDSQQTLNNGLWNLVCSLASKSTNRVHGAVSYNLVVPNWLIAALVIVVITVVCCFLSIITGIAVFCCRRFRAQPKEEEYLPVEE